MGFTINEEITTRLHYKDIALIAVAMGMYQEKYKETADKEVLDRMKNLVNRLGKEMANCPKENNNINEHDIVVVIKDHHIVSEGDEGTVIHIYKEGEAFEVEFADNLIATMNKDEIKKKV